MTAAKYKTYDVLGFQHKKILKKLMEVSEKRKKNDAEEKFEDIPLAPQGRLLAETFHRKVGLSFLHCCNVPRGIQCIGDFRTCEFSE